MPKGRIRAQAQDVYNDLARVSAVQQLGIVLEFDRHLDLAKLEEAVREVVRCQPILGCRWAKGRLWPHFEPIGARAAVIETVEADDVSAEAWRAVGEQLDPAAGPLGRVTLVRGGPEDALVVRLDHTAGDGQGAKRFATLLAQAYRTGSGGAAVSGSARSGWRLITAVGRRNAWRAMRTRQAPRPTWGMPVAGTGDGPCRFETRTIAPERFEQAREWGRQYGATVNDLLLAAFYRALFGGFSPQADRPMAVNVSFDMRRYLPEAAGDLPIMNLSSVETAMVARVPGETLGQTVPRVTAEMALRKSGMPGVGSVMLMQMSSLAGYATMRNLVQTPMLRGQMFQLSFPFLSNFGVLHEDDLGFGGFGPKSVVMIGPAARAPFFMLGASTYRGALTVSGGCVTRTMDPAILPGVLDRVAAGLPG